MASEGGKGTFLWGCDYWWVVHTASNVPHACAYRPFNWTHWIVVFQKRTKDIKFEGVTGRIRILGMVKG